MRICVINEFFYPDNTGGTGTVLADMARSLQDNYAEVQIEVITSHHLYRSQQELPKYEDWDGIPIHRLATPRPMTASFAKRLLANLIFSFAALFALRRMGKFDAVLVTTAPPTAPIAAVVYQWLTRTPFAYITYDLEPDRAIMLKVLSATHPVAKIMTRVQRRWLRAATRVIVLGRCMRDYLLDNYGLPAEKIAVIPIGFDPAKVYPMSRQTRFRAEHDLSGFVALYAGNFGRYHNFDTILDAARRLRDVESAITFVLVGNGMQRPHIEQRIETEGLTNVRLFPFVPEEDLSDMVASCDVSLVTLEPGMEGLCVPSKLYSTMAAGRATIAMVAAHSEVGQVITEAECGVQMEQGDAERLTESLLELSRNQRLTERMGRNARAALETQYATRQIAHQYYQALAAIANMAKAPDWAGRAVVAAPVRAEKERGVKAGKS